MILHLFKTDLRRSRLLFVAWLLLLVLECVLLGSGFRPSGRLLEAVYQGAAQLIQPLQLLILLVMIPFVVHEEPLVGTSAFWYTRPIWRRDLLRSKALFALTLVGLPLLTQVVVLVANRVTVQDIALAIPEIILANVGPIAAIALLATLTPGFARFAMFGAILLVTFILWSMVQVWFQTSFNPATLIASARGDGASLAASRGLVESLLSLVGFSGIIVHQYLTRKTKQSIITAIFTVISVTAVSTFWPWNFFAARPLPDFGAQADLSALKITLRGTNPEDVDVLVGTGLPRKNINGAIGVEGLPSDYEIMPQQVRPRISRANGEAFKFEKASPNFSDSKSFANLAALETALGGTPVVNTASPAENTTGLFSVDADVYHQQAAQPFDLSADIEFVVSKYVLISEMPLVRGTEHTRGSEHTTVSDVLRQGDGVEVILRQRNVSPLFSPAGHEPISSIFSAGNGATVYLLRNKKRNEAILLQWPRGGSFSTVSVGFGAAGAKRQVLFQQTLRLPFGPEEGRLTPPLNEAWLADSALVRLQLQPVAKFTRQLSGVNLKLTDHNRSAFAQEGRSRAFDPAVFANISLPENASKAQVRSYIETITILSQRQNAFSSEDPQVGLLRKVGADNLDVLIEASSDETYRSFQAGRWYVDLAIPELVRPEDKALILGALSAHPWLADVVLEKGWQGEARDTLIAGLKDARQKNLPPSWVKAVASFKDPSTYSTLKAYLVDGPYKWITFDAIRDLPGIQLADAIEQVWRYAKAKPALERVDAAAAVASSGRIEALDALLAALSPDENENQSAYWLKKLTPAMGDNAALVAWFYDYRSRIVYDATQKKFVLRASP